MGDADPVHTDQRGQVDLGETEPPTEAPDPPGVDRDLLGFRFRTGLDPLALTDRGQFF